MGEAATRTAAEVARERFFLGAALLMRGAPAGTEVGVDYRVWTIADRFEGVKMVPPGIHCAYYRCALWI